MIRIRPHKLFDLIKTDRYADRVVQTVLPDRNAPMAFDTALKLALAKLVQPRTFFEFGTFLGVQTFNMAMNLPACEFYTLDLDEDAYKDASIIESVRHLTEIQLERRRELAFLGTPCEKRIHCLRGDSTRFDFAPYFGKIDMVYVDGGHDERTIQSDTDNAFRLLARDRPTAIAWDDYGNRLSPAVKECLDARSETLFAIEESITVFYLSGVPQAMMEQLGS
jgi:hypothetical protein